MSEGGDPDVSTAAPPKRSDASQAPPPVPCLTLVAHPNVARSAEQLFLHALRVGRGVELSRSAPDFTRPGSALGLPLGDVYVSRQPIRFRPAAGGGVLLEAGAGSTRVTVDGEVVRGEREFGLAELARGVPLELADRVALLLHLATPDRPADKDQLGLLGESDGIRSVRAAIRHILDLQVSVLIRGETGTGKELVARAIHDRGPRRKGPFVSVNLGAIPRELAAAELFGAQRGAFTGATQSRGGYFQAAKGGTLFLDEVGETSPEVQVMLLRVLESGELYQVGGQTPVPIDVRLVAATDANLEERIRQGGFKAPLLHRLAGYEIRLPPLRERREDIGLLFHHFASKELASIGERRPLAPPADPHAPPWLSPSLAARLLGFSWPGNVRQLHNVTRQLVIGSRSLPALQLDARLAEELAVATSADGRSAPAGKPALLAMASLSDEERARRALLVELLGRHLGNVSAVARELDKARTQIVRWTKRYGIDPRDPH
jgi:two-component system, NtrC family, nitrogen regulation response regulator GlnG